MKSLTVPQGEILSFLIKMGGMTIHALNRKVVTSLEKKGFISVINDVVEVTAIGDKFYKDEIKKGRDALKKKMKDFKIEKETNLKP